MRDVEKERLFIAALVGVFFLAASFRPTNYFSYILDVLPVLAGIVVLIVTYDRFRFTTLVYALMGVQVLVALLGAHYTAAQVPFFEWLKDIDVFSRNNYDKFGHFFQGFCPAIIVREILLRISMLKKGTLLNTLIVCVCLAGSALYEILEWIAAITIGKAADDFLGIQGYQWDTQTDMLYALIGAIVALLIFHRAHDRAMAKRAQLGTTAMNKL